ncbi:MAG: GNAT family N-acetyltransferase [Cytophagaceae bacterium]
MKYLVKIETDAHNSHMELFLFNTEKHLKSQPHPERYTFKLIHNKTGIIHAQLSLFVKENQAVSPLRAPFGSVEFDSKLSFANLLQLLEAVDEFASERKLSLIRLVSYPFCYANENSQLLAFALLAKGYNMPVAEVNYHIDVDQEPFEKKIKLTERQKLKRCLKKGYVFSSGEMEEPDNIYDFIMRCRNAKGYPITLSREDFKALFDKLADEFVFFKVEYANKPVALSFGVKINSQILYNFYMADDPEYKSDSPCVLLLEGIYNYCQENKYHILDYGTASEHGVPNQGLIAFKESTGGKPSLKPVFEKIFS